MVKSNSGRRDADEGPDQANRVLGVAAILIGVAIVALLVGGGVYWWTTRSDTDALPVARLPGLTGTPVDRIELAAGALKDWNVLLISADTLRADRVGCYGNTQIQTPAIDRLARQGVRFRKAITPVPITLPSHVSMLTGLNPSHHGVRSNGLFRLSESAETLAARLKKRGYATGAAIGAYVLDSRFGLDQGFDTYDDDVTAGRSPTQFGYRERLAEHVNRPAIAWLRQHAARRFFLFVHYFDPHFPYAPPAPWNERYRHNPYDGEIAYVDTQVEGLLAALDELGLRRRTLVIFTSDHGEALGEHGERTHAIFVYDVTQHVPLIFSAPPPFPQDRFVTQQVGTIDIVPTVLALLGLPAPSDLDGVSLLDPLASRRSIYLESLYPKLTHHWAPVLGIRRDDFKFIHLPKPELYDLRADPRELDNLYAARQDLAAEMYDELKTALGGDPRTATDVQGNLEVDERTRKMLEGLGYVMPTASQRSTTYAAVLPDPKDMIHVSMHLVSAENKIIEGRYAEALEFVQRYNDVSPNDPRAAQLTAQIYRRLDRLDESLTWYRKSVTLGYEVAEAWSGIGAIYVLRNDLPKAERAYARALEIDPHSTPAMLGMGGVRIAQGRDEEAMRHFQDTLKYGKGVNAAMAHFGMSGVYRRAGKIQEADAALARAVEAEPTNPVLAQAAAAHSEKAGDAEQAIQRLRAAADDRPMPDVVLRLARLLNGRAKHDEAAGYVRKALTIEPSNADLHYELGMALLGLKQVVEATQQFQEAVKIDSEHRAALSQLGITLAQMKRFKESLPVMSRAVQVSPESYQARYNLGLVLANLGQYDRAVQELQEAIRLNPKDARLCCKLGIVYARQGKKDQAIAQYRKALAIDPKYAEAIKLLKEAGQR